MTSGGELPVRISPKSEVVVDLRAVLGGEGVEAVERALYVEVDAEVEGRLDPVATPFRPCW